MKFISNSPEQTMEIGAKILKMISPGDIITLDGDLGAGKTCLTKGLAKALHITQTVTSPTYNIVCEYQGDTKLVHMDLYRIEGIEEFEMLGVDELIFSNNITLIEWPKRIEGYFNKDPKAISIKIEKDLSRTISLTNF